MEDKGSVMSRAKSARISPMSSDTWRPSHRTLAAIIGRAVEAARNCRFGEPTPAERAATAVLDELTRQRDAAYPPDQKLLTERQRRMDAAVAIYAIFGPTYSAGYDGPRPIDERFFDAADAVLAIGRKGEKPEGVGNEPWHYTRDCAPCAGVGP